MKDHYHIDLTKYSLNKFKHSLQTRALIPSRLSLKDDLDARFSILEDHGITNLKELIDALKTKPKIEQFSKETGLSIDYLTLLRREANSYLPNPTRLDKFPGVGAQDLEKLAALGIVNTRQLLKETKTKEQREHLSQGTEIPLERVNEIVSLSDLSRVYGVGPVFARLIYDVGIHSIEEFVGYTAEEFIRIYEEQTHKKADFGVGEIQFSLELAKELDQAVER
jgi:predicted flap endonuclease-1-like 5' DNA nuclease